MLPRLQSFAPWHYYLKVILLLWSAFHLEFYMHSNIHYKWYLAAPLGLVYALIGTGKLSHVWVTLDSHCH